MSDFQARINKLVDEFVAQVTALARQAAMDTLTSALGSAAAARRKGLEPTATRPAVAAAAARRPKGAKRPQAEIEQTRGRVLDFIRANPGRRIERINAELGTLTRDLTLPLRKLIAGGQIRTEGEKRATTYYPADGKASRPAPAPAAPRRRKKK